MATHINAFNTIISQLTSIEINFDDEVHALSLLTSLLNSWEPMRAAGSNFVGKWELKLNNVRDQILAEEVRRIDSDKGTSSSSAINLKSMGRDSERNSNYGRGKFKSRNGRDKSKSGRRLEC